MGRTGVMVVIEVMPSALCDSHRAAGNWGVYPANGARRYITTRDWAKEVVAVDEDGYASIVQDATDDDLEEYEQLPEEY